MHRRMKLVALAICASVCLTVLTGCGAPDDVEFSVVTAPTDQLFGIPVDVRIEGLEPGESVRLVARSTDEMDQEFTSETTFVADENGAVYISKLAPSAGGYEGVDRFGVFWSMNSCSDVFRSGWRPARQRHGDRVSMVTCFC